MRRLLLSCAGLVLAIWVLALAAPSDRARLPHGTDSEAPDSAAPDRTPPEVQEMAGEPSRPDPDPSDDRVRITAADGRCCPELSVSLHDFIKPVVGTASQKDCELIPVSYRSAMREAGVTLGRRHQR